MPWKAVPANALASAAVILAGCASAPVSPLPERYEVRRGYTVAQLTRARTGAIMVQASEGYFLPTFEASVPLSGVATGAEPPRGGKWLARHAYHGACGGEFVITHPEWYAGRVGFVVTSTGVLPCEHAAVDLRPGHFDTHSVGELVQQPAFVRVQGYPLPDRDRPQMKREIVYNGRSGRTIYLLYREFIDDLARPAFYQDLRYDLDDSNTVTYRDWQIEIVEASNDGMQFRVLRDNRAPSGVNNLLGTHS